MNAAHALERLRERRRPGTCKTARSLHESLATLQAELAADQAALEAHQTAEEAKAADEAALVLAKKEASCRTSPCRRCPTVLRGPRGSG